jgi:hypothetical protein
LKTPISTSIPPGLSSETTFFNAFAYDGTSGLAASREVYDDESVVVDSFAPYTGTAVFHAQKNA